MDADPARFDCDACEVRSRSGELWPENHDAWAIWSTLSGRTVRDLHLAAWYLEQVTADREPADKMDVVARISLIRDTLEPAGEHGGEP